MIVYTTGQRVPLGGDAYAHPDLAGLLTPTDQVRPHPRNPRNGDTDAIVESVRVNGLYRPIYAQRSTGFILAGNHTCAAVLELGGTEVPVIWLDVDDEQATRILLADNRVADLGRYDEGLLLDALNDLATMEAGLFGTGYTDDDMSVLAQQLAEAEAAALDAADGDEGRAPTTGEMLTIADVTWGEPKHKPTHGEVWRLGRHTLVIAKVHEEWPLWVPLLAEPMLLAPYPEPYLTSSEVAAERPLLLVQPNVYLAGHLIDKHLSTHPDELAERL